MPGGLRYGWGDRFFRSYGAIAFADLAAVLRMPSDMVTSQPVVTSIAEENVRAVARIQHKAQQERSLAQRLSDWITVRAARESSIVLHLVWFMVWVIANSGHTWMTPFDPFPYTLLTTVVSLEAIFLTLFVLASENRLTQEADRRGQLDLQVNLLAEQEMTLVLRMLKEVCEHLELRETITSRKFLELVKRTDVGELAQRLEKSDASPASDPRERTPGSIPDSSTRTP